MDLLNRLRDFLRPRPSTTTPAERADHAYASSPRDFATEEKLRLIDAHWASVGELEPTVLTPFPPAVFTDGPQWPSARQGYRAIHRGTSTILTTDGLSDPFMGDDEELDSGFGMELFIETSGIPSQTFGESGLIPVVKTWPFYILRGATDLVARNVAAIVDIEEDGLISATLRGFGPEFRGKGKERFIGPDGAVGVLIGAPRPDFPDVVSAPPAPPIRLVPIFLLTAAESAFIKPGLEPRDELVRRLISAGTSHRCELDRPSLV